MALLLSVSLATCPLPFQQLRKHNDEAIDLKRSGRADDDDALGKGDIPAATTTTTTTYGYSMVAVTEFVALVARVQSCTNKFSLCV